jgi:hypothetical protein
MWTMLGDGQLVKDGKGRYSPTNPTNPTNPRKADTYGEKNHRVSGVSGVSGGCGYDTPKDPPVSFTAKPGESVTVAELQARREEQNDDVGRV